MSHPDHTKDLDSRDKGHKTVKLHVKSTGGKILFPSSYRGGKNSVRHMRGVETRSSAEKALKNKKQ